MSQGTQSKPAATFTSPWGTKPGTTMQAVTVHSCSCGPHISLRTDAAKPKFSIDPKLLSITRHKASWGDQLFGLARWAHNGGVRNVHTALSRCHFTSPLLPPGSESLWNQIPAHMQSLQDHELLLSCIRCCNTLPCLLSLGHRLHVSLPPPDPNYLNKQPGHISDSLKIMMTWPWLACSDFLAVYWA